MAILFIAYKDYFSSMKTLLLALMTLLLVSCKKEKNSTCWECEVLVNGQQKQEIKCGSEDGLYRDAQGNDLQCIEIH